MGLNTPRKKLLFLQHVSQVGGASWSLYQIIAAMQSDYDVSVALAQDGPLRSRLQSELGVAVIVDPRLRVFSGPFQGRRNLFDQRSLSGLLGWRATVKAAEGICRRLKPDVVHINTLVLYHAAIGCRQAGVPQIVLHVREPLNFRPGTWRDRLVRETIRAHVDAVLAISKANAAELRLPERTVLVPNWPDFTGRDGPVDFAKDYGISDDRDVILAMGGRHPSKGSLTAIRAMAEVTHDKAVLLVLGGKPAGSRLLSAARHVCRTLHFSTYGIEMDRSAAQQGGRVRLVGENLNVRSLIERARFLVCPFVESHFAKATIEAGALSKPTVVSAGAHLEESVIHEQTGLVVPAGDVAAWAVSMNRLLSNPSLVDRLGGAAKDFVSHHYDKATSLRKIRSAYESRPTPSSSSSCEGLSGSLGLK
jgi:glycosyltransferase involved in cell wall biosynthesis